jgi:hypothetical protein
MHMPTIESVGLQELASLRATAATLVGSTTSSNCIGSASVAMSSTVSSCPPMGTMVASFSDAASASPQFSWSNSIHCLQMLFELGELVWDALHVWGQLCLLLLSYLPSALAVVRAGSRGTMSRSDGGGGMSKLSSRSNSLRPNKVLLPVTEHGELGHKNPLLCPLHWRGDLPEQLLLGVGSGGMLPV